MVQYEGMVCIGPISVMQNEADRLVLRYRKVGTEELQGIRARQKLLQELDGSDMASRKVSSWLNVE
jgi:hypothetical protein